MESGAIFGQELSSILPQRFAAEAGIYRGLKIEEASQQAGDVRLDDRDGLIMGESSNGVRGVPANSRKAVNRLDRIGKLARILLDDDLRGGVEVTRPGIIPESLPGVENFAFGGSGEGGKVREPLHPHLIVGDDRGDLRLLEHEFRNQHCVGISGAAPRQIAAVLAVPKAKRTPEGSGVRSEFHVRKEGLVPEA